MPAESVRDFADVRSGGGRSVCFFVGIWYNKEANNVPPNAADGGNMKYIITTEGMGCEHCIKRVTAAMQTLNAAIIYVKLNDIAVDFNGNENDLRNAIEDLGFDVISIKAQ